MPGLRCGLWSNQILFRALRYIQIHKGEIASTFEEIRPGELAETENGWFITTTAQNSEGSGTVDISISCSFNELVGERMEELVDKRMDSSGPGFTVSE
ncbi:unnamed protein product [Bursaphelenchus xylophilus]|uniref:(pine wood nematode) hypothetical protein n=1 Tax=Bursaphelenchus xylophilus TaxID=6326 RepID=A0A1I7SVF5_BURXY|nr:unnamed protein product [Bursaphelenchus xylophilus]CAG9101383.1 unnamed protein product [Bursaphelenchus xylophilus]